MSLSSFISLTSLRSTELVRDRVGDSGDPLKYVSWGECTQLVTIAEVSALNMDTLTLHCT